MSNDAATSRIPRSALLLGLAGLMPFLVCAASQWLALPRLPPELGLRLGLAYGAIILSFLGGIRWGTAIGPYGARRQALEFSMSVLGPIAGWVALFLPAVLGLSFLVAGFLMQGLWDVTSVEAGTLPQWFGRLRMILTCGAVLSLLAMLVKLFI